MNRNGGVFGRGSAWKAVLGAALVVVGGCGGTSHPGGVLVAAPSEEEVTTAPLATGAAPATSSPAVPPTGQAAGSPLHGVIVTPHGIVAPALEQLPEGVRVRTPCGATAVVTHGTRVEHATIVLDPGHGGNEPGAISPDGLAEAGVNLAVSQKVKAILEGNGVDAVLTRTGDYNVDLATRGEMARDLDPRAFVSIHHNAEPDGPSDKPGTETYYQIGSADSKRLAGLIYEEVFSTLSQYSGVGWVADTDAGAKYRPGTHGDYYAVLRLPGSVTSALSEAAFISNPDEAALLARDDVQDAEANAIARGILRYLNTDDAGSGFVTPYPRTPPTTAPGPPPPPCVDPAL